MAQTTSTYHIVCVSDAAYIQHAAVMLCSLFENNPGTAFAVHLLTDTESAQEITRTQLTSNRTIQEALHHLCNRYHATLSIYPCPLDDIRDLPVGQWSTFMYLKLFIPLVLPREVHRCLFLDVDMVIQENIRPLYEIDLEGNVLAAAEDLPDCTLFKPRLELKPSDSYINSGVMVCDVQQWRHLQQQRDIFDFTRTIAQHIRNEQDVIACYFKGAIKLLPIRWNMVTFYFMQTPKIFEHYLPELPDARLHPAIIHFAAPIKPWFRDCRHPYRHLYRKYLSMTEWGKLASFPMYEKLSPRKRLNSIIKHWLCKSGLRRDPMFLIK